MAGSTRHMLDETTKEKKPRVPNAMSLDTNKAALLLNDGEQVKSPKSSGSPRTGSPRSVSPVEQLKKSPRVQDFTKVDELKDAIGRRKSSGGLNGFVVMTPKKPIENANVEDADDAPKLSSRK